MTSITMQTADLYHERRQAVRRLLAPLLPQPAKATVEQVGPGRDAFTLGALPLHRRPTSYLNPEDALVPTKVPNLLLNYYETWRQGRNADEYYLDRAYLHMHVASRGGSRQVLSLHCDPSLRPSDGHYRYKRGPQIHVEGANPDVSRAHVSLCLLDEHMGGSNIAALTKGLSEAVRMIQTEFFPYWERAGRN